MGRLVISYQDQNIVEASESASFTLSTRDKVMQDDVGVVFEADAQVEQATPTITVSNDGLVTATATQTAGLVSSGTTSSTYQLASKSAATYTPTESEQTIAANQWLTGVQTIAGISSTYVGTGVTRRGAYGDLVVSGRSVTALPGYYESEYAAWVTDAAQATPQISFNASTGVITASTTQPAGWVDGGQKSSTYSLPTKSATTITPTTTNQTIAAGQYLTGAQTILGDANLVPANIASGVSIFGVTGTHSGGGGSGDSQEDAIITRTISGTYENSRVTTIGRYAFNSCNSLMSVSFPAATIIEPYAFWLCTALTYVNAPLVTSISSYAFMRCAMTSVGFSSVTTIGDGAFMSCYSLMSVSFPLVTTIGSSAFYGCASLASVNFPLVTVIRPSMFGYCSALVSVSLPAVTTIGSSAFYGCSALVSADFPNVSSLWTAAFCSCVALMSVNMPLIKKVENYVFNSCSALASVSFSAVYSIGNNAFDRCRTLSFVSFPAAYSIGAYAFRSCYALSYAEFPAVQSIYSNAFAFCSSLAEIKLGSAITLIGSYAFSGCANLMSVNLTEKSTVPTLSANAFSSTPMLKPIVSEDMTTVYGSIYVKASLVAAYQAATNWALISDRIVGVETDDGTT